MYFVAVFPKDGSDILFFTEGGDLSRNLEVYAEYTYGVACSNAYLLIPGIMAMRLNPDFSESFRR